jgi:hypothetical protein
MSEPLTEEQAAQVDAQLDTNYAPFVGDGRTRISSSCVLPYTTAGTVTRAQARDMIDRFIAVGQSTHSAQAGTLWVLLTWLQFHKVPFDLHAEADLGYTVTRAPRRFANPG